MFLEEETVSLRFQLQLNIRDLGEISDGKAGEEAEGRLGISVWGGRRDERVCVGGSERPAEATS